MLAHFAAGAFENGTTITDGGKINDARNIPDPDGKENGVIPLPMNGVAGKPYGAGDIGGTFKGFTIQNVGNDTASLSLTSGDVFNRLLLSNALITGLDTEEYVIFIQGDFPNVPAGINLTTSILTKGLFAPSGNSAVGDMVTSFTGEVTPSGGQTTKLGPEDFKVIIDKLNDFSLTDSKDISAIAQTRRLSAEFRFSCAHAGDSLSLGKFFVPDPNDPNKNVQVNGEVEIRLVAVPEPSTAQLFALSGLLMLGVFKLGRRRR